MAYREIEEVLPDQEEAADDRADPPRLPPPQEEAADTPEDWSEPAPPSVEPADTPVAPDEMVIPQIHEEEAAREELPVLVYPPPILTTPPVVVESPVAANPPPPVQLERNQRTGAPPSYLKDVLCDAVEKHPLAIINKIWGNKQLRVAMPRYKETQL